MENRTCELPVAPGSGCGDPEVLELIHGRDEPGVCAHTARWISGWTRYSFPNLPEKQK